MERNIRHSSSLNYSFFTIFIIATCCVIITNLILSPPAFYMDISNSKTAAYNKSSNRSVKTVNTNIHENSDNSNINENDDNGVDATYKNAIRDVPHNRKVVLISLDGFRWDFIHGRAKTPTFDFIKKRGVYALNGLECAFITNTMPNHFTLVTGLYPESHGMLDNIIYDEEMDITYVPVFYNREVFNDPKWYRLFEPIWLSNQIQKREKLRVEGGELKSRDTATGVSAQAESKTKLAGEEGKGNGNENREEDDYWTGRSGVLFWMGCDEPLDGILPHRFLRHRYDMDEKEEVKILLDWLSGHDNGKNDRECDKEKLKAGAHETKEPKEPINLALVYFPEPDALAHKFGPESQEVTDKIEYIDNALGYFIEELYRTGLASETDVIVLGDHGFTSISPELVINLDDFLDRDTYTVISPMPGSVISVYPKEGEHK